MNKLDDGFKSCLVTLAVVGLVIGTPLALISWGRHQGWEKHKGCLAEELRREPEPEPPGTTTPLRQALGLGPASAMTHGQFAEALLAKCEELH